MKRISAVLPLVLTCLAIMQAQQSPTSSSATVALPRLLRFSGTARDVNGKPLTGIVGVTFSLYSEQAGGSPLWLETQNVQLDGSGRYSILLGSTKAEGLPVDLFTSEQAHWVGVQVSGQAEEARALLVSAPYALKAGDAETVGGFPPSAFMLATPSSVNKPNEVGGSGPGSEVPAAAVISGSGTADYVPLWINPSIVGNSVLFQSGSGSSATVGINTTAPAATLDVNGSVISRGALQLPSVGTASAGGGFGSQPFSLQGSAFNSTSGKAIGPMFQWQTEPIGNNSSNPAGTLNLLYGNGSGAPSETGLNIASNGQITFATGQIFPGTGNGTITGVTAGTDLLGGGTGGNVTLNLDTTKVVTGVTAGTDLIGGGTGGNLTLSLDTTQVPQLNAPNVFTANQTITGSQTIYSDLMLPNTSSSSSGVIMFGGNPFIHNWGVAGSYNAFLGSGAGNFSTSASFLTAVGDFALLSNTTGNSNTAIGYQALESNQNGAFNTALGTYALVRNTSGQLNTATGLSSMYLLTTGSNNTATGFGALSSLTTGSNNTAFGYLAGTTPDSMSMTGSANTFLGYNAAPSGANETTLSNATALGAYANVTQSNAMILGSINGLNQATADTLVGIGTTAPVAKLSVSGTETTTNGYASAINLANTASGGGNWYLRAGANGTRTPAAGLTIANDIGYWMTFTSGGAVGINTLVPDATLSVNGSADKPGGGSWGTFSDRRLKTLEGNYSSGLSQILKINPVHYRYLQDNALGIRDLGEHIGVVAQEVQKAIPEAVTENNKGYLLVNNDPILWAMLNAIKEQQREIVALRAQARMRQSSTAAPVAASAAYDSAKDHELRAVRRQLHELQKKDTRLEVRLTHLEHALTALSPQTITVATAEESAAVASGTKGAINASSSR